jgi:hypothetical protein
MAYLIRRFVMAIDPVPCESTCKHGEHYWDDEGRWYYCEGAIGIRAEKLHEKVVSERTEPLMFYGSGPVLSERMGKMDIKIYADKTVGICVTLDEKYTDLVDLGRFSLTWYPVPGIPLSLRRNLKNEDESHIVRGEN